VGDYLHLGDQVNYGRTGKTKDTFLTPEWILDLVREFGDGMIHLDPATNLDNTTGADVICVAPGTTIPPFSQTRGVILEDGLSNPWTDLAMGGLIWCNPPFIHKALFLKKATQEYHKGAEILMIVPSDPTAKWWQTWVSPRLSGATAVCYLSKRPTFLDPETGKPPLDAHGKPTSAMFGCAIVYFGSDIQKFRDIFGPHGDVDAGRR